MPTPSIARTRIVGVAADTFSRFPRLTRLAALATAAESEMPGSCAARVWQQEASAEFRRVYDDHSLSVALDMVREAEFFLRYGRAIAWIEVEA
jgi:predicted pyridoxine 5'-phosphate oxidase superfamily flavin-nucleotide-binding protein